MNEDRLIMDSAERVERERQETARQKSQNRTRTAGIVGVAGAAAYALAAFVGAVATCNADCEARKIERYREFMQHHEECSAADREGCWRLLYEECVRRERARNCLPLVPKHERE